MYDFFSLFFRYGDPKAGPGAPRWAPLATRVRARRPIFWHHSSHPSETSKEREVIIVSRFVLIGLGPTVAPQGTVVLTLFLFHVHPTPPFVPLLTPLIKRTPLFSSQPILHALSHSSARGGSCSGIMKRGRLFCLAPIRASPPVKFGLFCSRLGVKLICKSPVYPSIYTRVRYTRV